MARSKRSIDDTVSRLDKLFAELPPQDALIMSMGFIAGWNGYTPLSAMLGLAGNGDPLQWLKDKAASGDVVAGYQSGFFTVPGIPVVGMVAGGITSLIDGLSGNPSNEVSPEQNASLVVHISMGCIGAIEAYAITRPGTVQGIGEIVKGIGEIVPG